MGRLGKVFVIGSLTREKDMESIANFSRLLGYDADRVRKQPDKEFKELVRECYTKIVDADVIIAVRKENEELGEGTIYEVEFARAIGKQVFIF